MPLRSAGSWRSFGFFLVAGVQLAWLGGSFYYLLAGVAMIATGALIGRSDRRGLIVYGLFCAATVLWALWEVGLDWLQLVPRVVAPTVLLALIGLAYLRRLPSRGTAVRMAGVGVAVIAIGAGALIVVRPSATYAEAQVAAAPSATGTGDWTHYGGTLAGNRYSPLGDITPANVNRLEVAWTQHSGDVVLPAEQKHERAYYAEATPIQVGGTLYTCTPHSWVQAIDPATGRTKWTFKAAADVNKAMLLACRGVSYYEAPAGTPCPRRIFTPSYDAKVYALDADTGRPCPDFGTGGHVDLRDHMGASPGGYQISTSPPIVANGRLIIGERIIDGMSVDEPAGVVRAYDPVSGAAVWAWDVGRGDDAVKPLTGDAVYTRGTPNVWGAMTADAASGLVYLPTGNATPDFWTGRRRPFDARFGTSIVALDIATGRLRWHRQLVHDDSWDMDLPVGPSLLDLHGPDGRIVPALVQTTKTGQLFLLNRLTGAPIAAVVERPVPTAGGVPGVHLSPTQPMSVDMPSLTPPSPTERSTWGATPIDQLVCRIQFRQARSAGIFQPMGTTSTIARPGSNGVTNWGGAAVDPARGIMTVNSMSVAFRQRLIPTASAEGQKLLATKAKARESFDAVEYLKQSGTPYIASVGPWLGVFGAPCTAPPWGRMTAIDLHTRKVMWSKPLGTARDTGLFGTKAGLPITVGVPNMAGSIITAGGIAFIGATADQYLRAFDLRTGAELWKARLPAGAQATPMTYRGRDGRQYVVITAGGHGGLGTRYGDYTIAFALPHTRNQAARFAVMNE